MKQHSKRSIFIMFAAFALASCGETSGPEAVQEGELGNGTFIYDCHEESDAQCDENSVLALPDETLKTLPSVAVGAAFRVRYDPKEGDGSIDSPVPDFITNEAVMSEGGSGAVFLRAARAGIGVLSGSVSIYPEDLVHVRIEEAKDLVVTRIDTTGNFGFDGAGVVDVSVKLEDTYFRVVPVTEDKRILSGALPCMWTTSDEAVVTITSDPTSNVVGVQMKQQGTATLHVKLGDLEKDVTVTVGGAT
jgi:hypothetical protein